jgi:hypothetical protein
MDQLADHITNAARESHRVAEETDDPNVERLARANALVCTVLVGLLSVSDGHGVSLSLLQGEVGNLQRDPW